MNRTPKSLWIRAAAGWLRRLVLPIAVVVIVAGHTPWIAQRVPRWTFPILAAAGAALALYSFVSTLVRYVRERHLGTPRRLRAVTLNAAAVVVFVLLPLTHVVRAVTPTRDGTPRVHAGFGAWLGAEGFPQVRAHRGIDVGGRVGADVLAAAAGRVSVARDNGGLCGLIVVIDHEPHGLRTVYCHLSELAVRVGDVVARGQRIGALGTTGQRAWPGFEHVHLEVQRGGDVNALEDPLARMVGCFDATRAYPSDRLVLTYPVRC